MSDAIVQHPIPGIEYYIFNDNYAQYLFEEKEEARAFIEKYYPDRVKYLSEKEKEFYGIYWHKYGMYGVNYHGDTTSWPLDDS